MISLFGSSLHPEKINNLINSINNDIEYEIVICGPRKEYVSIREINGIPFKYIYSDFKPVQCAMIAATYAKGRYFLHIVDDIYFESKAGLSCLIDEFEQYSVDSLFPILMSTRLKRDDYSFINSDYYLYGDINYPIPVSLFCSKELFFKLNGFSSSFITSMADANLLWRAIDTFNAKFYISNSVVIELKNINELSLFNVYGKSDINTLLKIKNNSINLKFFQLNNIESIQIKPMGMWRFKGIKFKSFIKKILLLNYKIFCKMKKIFKY